jgi:hypothetical protein
MTMLADLKSFLGLTLDEQTAFNDVLDMILDSVIVEADRYMGIKYFATVNGATEKFDGFNAIFSLGYANVNVLSVTLVVEGETEEVVSSDYYIVNAARGIVKIRSGELQVGRDSVHIKYSGGYGEDAAPSDLRFKVIKQASYEFRRRKDPGLSGVRYPDGSVSKYEISEWLPDVEEVLNRYRRILL